VFVGQHVITSRGLSTLGPKGPQCPKNNLRNLTVLGRNDRSVARMASKRAPTALPNARLRNHCLCFAFLDKRGLVEYSELVFIK
jgi:hypothetical protein